MLFWILEAKSALCFQICGGKKGKHCLAVNEYSGQYSITAQGVTMYNNHHNNKTLSVQPYTPLTYLCCFYLNKLEKF